MKESLLYTGLTLWLACRGRSVEVGPEVRYAADGALRACLHLRAGAPYPFLCTQDNHRGG